MVMDNSKMSVGLDAQGVNVALSAPWLPSPSPLKLATPTLESLANSDWALAQNTANTALPTGMNTNLPISGSALNLSTGFSPRYSPDILRMSPGVSGSLAGNLQPNGTKNGTNSLAELFMTNEYNISTPTPGASHATNANEGAQKDNAHTQGPGHEDLQHSRAHREAASQQIETNQAKGANLQPTQQATSEGQMAASRQMAHMHSRQMTQQLHMPPKQDLIVGEAMGAAAPYPTHQMDQPQHSHMYSRPAQQMQTASAPMGSAPQYAYSRQMHQSLAPPHAMPPGVPQGYASVSEPVPAQPQPSMQAQQGGQLPPRPQVKAFADDTRHVTSGALVEAQRNAQEKADQFAMSRKRERKDSETVKSRESEGDEDSKLSPAEVKKRRYNRRLELNRQSAAVSRVRRRAYVKELEDKLVTVEQEKVKLERQVGYMNEENTRLREQMRQLHNQLGGPPGNAS